MRGLSVLQPGLVAIGLASGCTPVQQAAVDAALAQGEAGIKAAHDREALVLKQLPCSMSVGGYVRVLSDAERSAIMALCGGEQRLTLQDLASMGQAIQLLQGGLSLPPGALGMDVPMP